MTVTDTLPAGVTFDSATPSQGSCSESSGTVTCALGTLATAPSATVDDQGPALHAGHDHEPGDGFRHDRRPGLGNNAASATTTVDPAADLSLTKTDSPDPVLAGELLTYTLTAHNAGPQDATGVTLTDTLPGRRDLRLRHALAGHLLRVERDRHLRARHDRRRGRRHRRDQGPSLQAPARSRTRPAVSPPPATRSRPTTPPAPRPRSTRPPTCR